MSPPAPPYRRGPAGPRETWIAALAGVAVGAAVFHLARTWLRREPVGAAGDRDRGGSPARPGSRDADDAGD